MQISGSNGTTKPADYQPGINNMGLFNYAKSVVSTAVNTPVHALLRSFRDNVLAEHVTPVPGSVLYCDLAAGYAEHSGIYVGGGGTKCIVELSRQQGRCVINLVSPGEFISGEIGFSIYVSSRNGPAVGKKSVARAPWNWWDRIWAVTTLQLTTVICSPVGACVKKSPIC